MKGRNCEAFNNTKKEKSHLTIYRSALEHHRLHHHQEVPREYHRPLRIGTTAEMKWASLLKAQTATSNVV